MISKRRLLEGVLNDIDSHSHMDFPLYGYSISDSKIINGIDNPTIVFIEDGILANVSTVHTFDIDNVFDMKSKEYLIPGGSLLVLNKRNRINLSEYKEICKLSKNTKLLESLKGLIEENVSEYAKGKHVTLDVLDNEEIIICIEDIHSLDISNLYKLIIELLCSFCDDVYKMFNIYIDLHNNSGRAYIYTAELSTPVISSHTSIALLETPLNKEIKKRLEDVIYD